MGLGKSFFTFHEYAYVTYHHKCLAFLNRSMVLIIPFGYFVWQLFFTRMVHQTLQTNFYFSVNSQSGKIVLRDLQPGTGSVYDLNHLLFRDSEDVMFVTTYFDDVYEEMTGCKDDGTAIDPDGELDWCIVNKTRVFIDIDKALDFHIDTVARISCTLPTDSAPISSLSRFQNYNGVYDWKFSNFDREEKKLQTHYYLSIRSLLELAPSVSKCGKLGCSDTGGRDEAVDKDSHAAHCECCETTCPYIGYLHGNGLDMSVQYDWMCDLGEMHDMFGEHGSQKGGFTGSRYMCAAGKDNKQSFLKLKADSISSSSIVTKELTIQDPNVLQGQGGKAARRRRFIATGLQVRFRGTGGCQVATSKSMVSLLAEAFAVQSVLTGFFLVVLLTFKASKYVPDPRFHVMYDDESEEWEVVRTFDPKTVDKIHHQLHGCHEMFCCCFHPSQKKERQQTDEQRRVTPDENKPTSVELGSRSPSTSDRYRMSDTWECISCLFPYTNPISRSTCEACGAGRPNSAQSRNI